MKSFSLWMMLVLTLVLAGCRPHYKVIGENGIDALEGRKLYLKRYANEELVNMDSTTVQHGHFEFSGTLDSTLFAHLFVENESLMPIVLEEGEVHLNFTNEEQSLGGTPLNDSLYSFVKQKGVVDELMHNIPHKESALIMAGYDHDEIILISSDKIPNAADFAYFFLHIRHQCTKKNESYHLSVCCFL